VGVGVCRGAGRGRGPPTFVYLRCAYRSESKVPVLAVARKACQARVG
jgi:hypothetical protein